MIGLLLTLFCLVAAVPSEAQQGLQEMIRRQSVPTPTDQARLSRITTFSNDAIRSLMRQSAFDAALSSMLDSRSEFGPEPLKRLERESGFDPQMSLRLERRSEVGPEDARRIQSASQPPNAWTSSNVVVSAEYHNLLTRNSQMSPSEFQLIMRSTEGGELQVQVQRSSIPSGDFLSLIRLQSLGSATQSRLINRLSTD